MQGEERQKGTIYYCEDRVVVSHVTQSEGALVTYQPADSPCVGLNCDETGRAIEADVLAGAWYLTDKGFRRVDRGGQAVAYRDSVLRTPLFIHIPNDELQAQFRDTDLYFKKLAVHKLKERYQKPSEPPDVPEILKCYDVKDLDFTRLATFLESKCAFITLWALHDSGFGWHFIVFNGTKKFGHDCLGKLAKRFRCRRIDASPAELPRW
jgi:hypothetical protein